MPFQSQAHVAGLNTDAHCAAHVDGLLWQGEIPACKVHQREVVGRVVADHGCADHRTGGIVVRQWQIQPRHHVGGGAAGHKFAVFKQHQVVGQARHFVHGVADVEHGNLQLAVELFQVGQDFSLAFGVQRGQWLVHQQQARAGGQGAGDGDALALAT